MIAPTTEEVPKSIAPKTDVHRTFARTDSESDATPSESAEIARMLDEGCPHAEE